MLERFQDEKLVENLYKILAVAARQRLFLVEKMGMDERQGRFCKFHNLLPFPGRGEKIAALFGRRDLCQACGDELLGPVQVDVFVVLMVKVGVFGQRDDKKLLAEFGVFLQTLQGKT